MGLTPLAIQETSVDTTEVSFNSNVTVENTNQTNLTDLGVNPSSNFHFGEIETNANYTKWVEIGVADYSRVEVSTEGNISEVLEYRKSRVVDGGNARIAVKIFPREEGYYEGRILVNVESAENKVGRFWLKSGLSRLS